jgi:chloramphenicol 3-O-phosphotransferase
VSANAEFTIQAAAIGDEAMAMVKRAAIIILSHHNNIHVYNKYENKHYIYDIRF